MVEEKFGFEMADKLLTQPELKSKGVYTAVGTYDFDEMLCLITMLGKETKTPIPYLLEVFGNYLFSRLLILYPLLFEDKKNVFEFLTQIDKYIHVEVLKLYPDAQLPKIITQLNEDKTQMTMIYTSERKLSDLALGLINGCINHFNEKITVSVVGKSNDGSLVTIVLNKK
ncbi:MAG: heme NO-binding domain-containing protein [Bacteroidetes bacterium]|nr:heme NO-binding domain-containing protein [Bacteroidota bacterium]